MNSSQSTVLQMLDKYKKMVWPVVDRSLSPPDFPKQFQIPENFTEFSDLHWKTVREYPHRKGKYIRPTLLLLVCGAMGGDIGMALHTAAALQLSEEWLLVHDDIEDDSPIRRGKPAIHKMYGTELGINAGDTIQIFMWKALWENYRNLDIHMADRITEEFFLMLTRTTLGQTAELTKIQDDNPDIDYEEYFYITDGKTSYYSVAGPLRLGAIIAGADDKQMAVLTEFGKNLGRTFQIIDDILDISGDFSGLKGEKGNDIFENKKTLILGHLYRQADDNDKKKLRDIYRKTRKDKSREEVNWVTEKMSAYGSINYARKKADEYARLSKNILKNKLGFLRVKPYYNELESLIEFFLQRSY